MKHFELEEKMLPVDNKRLINNFRRYRDYNTIRRNLREAYSLINSIIELQSTILNEEDGLENHEKDITLAKVSYYHIIILYARWFKLTKDKVSLKPGDFFKDDKKEFRVIHNYIMNLRDKYIAHNEKDILGGDNVIVEACNSKDVKLLSYWKENFIINSEMLKKVKKCIEIVHNEIDATEIPKYERLLIDQLKETEIINKLI